MFETRSSAVVLARKYRPRKFSDLIGHEVVSKTISSAILSNRLHHAFLFTGTRGAGKTTSARIIALTINCKNHKVNNGIVEPCLECESCKSILSGSCPDITEIDAASNTGVDSMRSLIEQCNFAPLALKYKVYIIDEVHMLSKSAFNALLKTLEEPQDSVKFIFATTEIKKIPMTILSRCQKFLLKNIPDNLIESHLGNVASMEGVSISQDALVLLGKYAMGSMRDGLSLLDQAINIANGVSIDATLVKNMLSIPDKIRIAELFYNMYIGDINASIASINDILASHITVDSLLSELLEITSDAMKMCSKIAINTICIEFNEKLSKLDNANVLNMPRTLRMWQVITSSLEESKIVTEKLYLHALVFKLCYASNLPTPVEMLKLIQDDTLRNALSTFPSAVITE